MCFDFGDLLSKRSFLKCLKYYPICLKQQNLWGFLECITTDDFIFFPTDDMRWVKILATGDVPGGRASHSSAVFKDHLYIFGGIGPDGTLDTTYKYHIGRETSLSCVMVNGGLLENASPPQLLGFTPIAVIIALELHQYKTKCSIMLKTSLVNDVTVSACFLSL